MTRGPDSSNKSRWFVITIWDVELDYDKVFKDNPEIVFLAYGEEICPTTQRPHHQAFIYFKNPRSASVAACWRYTKGRFGEPQARMEVMFGAVTSSERYCSKESSLIKIGKEPKQGFRGDLIETKDAVMAGEVTVDQICVEDPMTFHQYGRTLERLETIRLRKCWRNWMTEGVWIHGPAGAGKSHMAFDGFHPDTHYVKNVSEDWWDGYKGQEVVILNEFRGHQMRFSELLDLVDKWPKTVKVRNREPVPFLAKKVIVASIHSPQACYESVKDEPWDQFYRRFKVVELEQKCSEGNNGTSEP